MVAVGLSDLGKGGYSLSAPRGLGETEGQGFLGAFRGLDPLHLFEELDPGLGLGSLGCLGPETADEILVMRDFPLLVAISGLVLSLPLGFLHEVLVEVSLIAVKLPVTDLEDAAADRVEKLTVVGNRKDGAGKFFDLFLKPAQGLEVEVIGRFVEHQEIGFHDQQTGQVGPHDPPSAQGAGGLVEVLRMEGQAGKDFFGLGLEGETVQFGKALEGFQAIGIFGVGGFPEGFHDSSQFRGDGSGELEHRLLPRRGTFLGKVSDAGSPFPLRLALVRFALA